jgi:transcription-repair coupling factor (superfamily II helicase)
MTDHEIWGRPRRRIRPRRFRRGILPSELQSLKPGDYVVHIEHGVGIYQGMERLPADGGQTDCLLITYQKGDKLYVPVDQLDLIQRYSAGEGAAPRVSTLGGTGWQKLKSRVKRRIKMMAEDLIQTYARRRSLPGHAFGPDTVWQREMEAAFPYEETPDQFSAIEDVKRDMESERPMDRLVCGDVGYGKTEVAIRAAFKAAMEGKQVAVLVPTTLLAEQHLGTFRERMQNFPLNIEMLSRFRTRAEQNQILEKLRLGQIEIVIGTHRLLSKDVVFHNLGLIVVDEEQRFGVRHKEALKKLRTQVDVLTLTATPIPRTLHMALMGARDMSSINTPPRDRQPIHTEIVNFSDDVIVDALLREADRGGQSFFVHNRVMTIENVHVHLSKLVPGLRVGVAHGQMPERHLERVMLDFLKREYDVLLSTMIIESGLDIPSVNTILIDRADAFGLAQLYQIRGRIGRSARKAFAYLLVPPDRALTETAQKRLRVIDELEELGSGFQLAMRDLEIRGAGNILGAEQSGFIVNVGFDMYCRLLDEAVRELKGVTHEEAEPARVSTDLDAYLPESYVPDRAEKVKLYKKLADANELGEIAGIEEEIRDRFGALPIEGQRLVDLRRLRVLATSMGVRSIILRAGLFEVLFRRQMTRDEVKALLKGTAVPVEFGSTGDRGFRITRFREASVAEALRLLQVIREAQAKPSVRTPAS